MSGTKWITSDLFEKALKSFYKWKEVTILQFDVEAAVPTGDCFTSDITRVQISFCKGGRQLKETMSVIVKCQPRGNLVEKWTTDLNFFKTEIEMFGKTLPLMYDILGPDFKGYLSSMCLYTTEVPNLILILEDLRPLGYIMSPRRNGFDMEHCILVMKKLAVFHAASVVMVDKDPSAVENYSGGIYTTDDISAKWIVKGFQSLANACKLWKGYEKYGEKIEQMGDYVARKAIMAGSKTKGGFNVLNHGDMWANNMLFKYEKDQVVNVKFIDFQLVKYSSPAVDLHYFIASCPTEEVREQLDILLDVYYGNLLITLSSLHYSLKSIPTRDEFRKDYEHRAFYGLLGAATIAPLVKASQRKDATFDDLTVNEGPGSFREHCYTNDCYAKTMQQLLPYYDSLGVFN